MKIERVRALEILDSRGQPTIEAEVMLSGGILASAQVPSGASTGLHEAVELRDRDPERFRGKGVLRAVANIDGILGPAVRGLNAADQPGIDARLIETDCSPDKSRLGANAILAVSCAVARAAALRRGIPLWRHLSEMSSRPAPRMPLPMINIVSGGLHAGRNLEFQDFLAIPQGYPNLAAALEATVRVHFMAGKILTERGCVLTGVADEGGWGPRLGSNEEAAAVLREAIGGCGARMDIGLDVAATHFFGNGKYALENRELSAVEMADLLEPWIHRYGVVSIEDPCAEDDWDGWIAITARLGKAVRLIGDDLFATNAARLERGIRERAANSVLVKMNQIGTLTETFEVIDRAREAGFGAVISARSGETEDSFLADLAVGSGAGQIKIGSVTRSERLSKYNRLLQIERREITAD
ncbi:MAG TPA: phosphopyruvate hydratase [Bryobacteraceae bacterium]|nr:phosphopyruvate hydratase [Bryobacteraceae bacterium]